VPQGAATAALHHQRVFSQEELNERSHLPGSRRSILGTLDRPAMRVLPQIPYVSQLRVSAAPTGCANRFRTYLRSVELTTSLDRLWAAD
jgi:hypothetical protein